MQKNKGKHLIFELLFALALLALLIAILVSEISRASDAYFYERTQLVTYVQCDTLTGYIFREEIAADTLNDGPVDYLVENGTPVQKGDVLAQVYRDGSEDGTQKEKAAVLHTRIAALEAALAAAPEWKNAYVADYAALMRELSAGNAQAALQPASDTLVALCGRDAENDTDALSKQISALKQELAALTAHTNDPLSTMALRDGTFYRSADGYEALFGTNQVADLTPDALDRLLAQTPKLDHVIGKLVCKGPWHLAVPLERELAKTYTPNTAYTVCFDAGSVTMTLERIHVDDTDRALLIFASETSPLWLSPTRKQSVRVERAHVTGLSIPADALGENNTLFVLQDGVARQKHVTPILSLQGCVLIAPDEENGITVGERIIVSAKQLFDGKVLE